jgi:hypothetical protein
VHSESVVSFVDAWIGPVRKRFPQKFAERLPTVLRLVFEEIVFRD